MERNEEEDVYQEEIKEHKNLTVPDGAILTELATRDIELMEEEQGPSKTSSKITRSSKEKYLEIITND
jgi:hypothetical protein